MATPVQQGMQFMEWFSRLPKWYLVVSAAGIALLFLGLGWLFQAKKKVTHGSARWATLPEIKAAGLMASTGMVVGQLRRQVLRAPQRHVLLCGPSGSQKDRSHNFPTTISEAGSMVIVDVKDGGENWTLCRQSRERRGPVFRFAPGERHSHSYNPLSSVRVGQPEEFRDVSALVGGLMAPKKRGTLSSESSQFFEHKGAVAARATILYLLHYGAPGQRTLAGCHHAMAQADSLIEAMQQVQHPEIRTQGERLAGLRKHSGRQFEGEWGTAQQVFDLFGDPLIAAHTSTSDFRLLDLQYGRQPMTLYLGAESPKDLQYLYPLFRAVLELACHQLTKVPQQYKSQRHSLLFLLNEFAELGWMPIVEEMPAEGRSYDLWFTMVVQDLEQLFGTYGEHTTLWGNLTTKVFHAPVNDKTAERLSRMLGDATIEVESRSYGMHRSMTRHAAARRLMTAGEVLGMSPHEVLIWSQGCPAPIKAQKLPYWQG